MAKLDTWERIKKYKEMYTWPMNVIVGYEYMNERFDKGGKHVKRPKFRK